MLNRARQVQRVLARHPTPRDVPAANVPLPVREARHVLSLHYEDARELVQACLDGNNDAARIASRFGLSQGAIRIVAHVTQAHVSAAKAEAARKLALVPRDAAERRASRRFFRSISTACSTITIDVAHDLKCILNDMDGFRPPPQGWSPQGEASLRSLLRRSKAGVTCLETVRAESSGSAQLDPKRVALVWTPKPNAIDLGTSWASIIALATLRNRAAFKIAVTDHALRP